MTQEELRNTLLEQLNGDACGAEDLVDQIERAMEEEDSDINHVVSCKITRNDYADASLAEGPDDFKVIHFDLKTIDAKGKTWTSDCETCFSPDRGVERQRVRLMLLEKLNGDIYAVDNLLKQFTKSMKQEGKTLKNIVSIEIISNSYIDQQEDLEPDHYKAIRCYVNVIEKDGKIYRSLWETSIPYHRTYSIKIEGVVHSDNEENFITSEEDLIKLIKRTGINNLNIKVEEIKFNK